MNIQNVIKTAQIADDLFERAVKAAGYKSRWDRGVNNCQAVRSARLAKYSADRAVHEAFELCRQAGVEKVQATDVTAALDVIDRSA